jgi:hypothetical protein
VAVSFIGGVPSFKKIKKIKILYFIGCGFGLKYENIQ